MFILKKIGCRLFQMAFRLALPILPYREPKIVPSLEKLSEVFSKENTSSVLVVTDRGIVNNGLLDGLVAVLSECGVKYAVYSGTQPNPTVENVEDALLMYKEHACDTIIAVGGGSSMDCAKGVGVRVAYPDRPLGKMSGVLRVLRSLPTLIAIPTTAGTGSETTLAAVITDQRTESKYAIMSFPLIPRYAVLDPALTYTLPPHLTATTGMDALTHAIEAYIGRSTTKRTRELATDAVRLIFENIELAYREGNNAKARENMLHAAYKAGVAFSMSYVGYVHAIAHSLGGKYGTPHGLANAVILPHVLDVYGKSVYKKLKKLAIVVGIAEEKDNEQIAAERFISAIRELNRRMNIPEKLEVIQAEDIPELAAHAEREANPLYPVPLLMTAKELSLIYRKLI